MKSLVIACVMGLVAVPAAAQDTTPKAELGAGYQFVRGEGQNLIRLTAGLVVPIGKK